MKKGFTLAEVLITLGIIGVVAALTIPTLISNYQKKSYVTALQKNYANLQNGFKLMAATEGVDYLEQTQFWKDMKKGNFSNEAITESIKNNMSKYFKISEVYAPGAEDSPYTPIDFLLLNGDSYGQAAMICPVAILQDGTGLIFMLMNDVINVGVDVNGPTEPNTLGRDVFWLVFPDNINDDKTSATQLLTQGQYYFSEGQYLPYSKQSQYCGEIGSTDISSGESGENCIDRIIEEGWKMNY